MTELLQDRSGKNESLFREYNERLEARKAEGEESPSLTDWVCECANETCSTPVRLTMAEYESVRADPTYFLVAPSEDHVVGDVERVVERHERFWIVEKVGQAGATSEKLEPRSRASADSGTGELEDLARRYFALFNAQELDKLREVLHPEVVLVLKAMQPGTVLRGRDDVIRFMEKEFSRRLWESVVHECEPLGANGVVVSGRIRWMDDERVLRDDPRVWALEFRDGLLIRSVPVHTVSEAESILSSPDLPG